MARILPHRTGAVYSEMVRRFHLILPFLLIVGGCHTAPATEAVDPDDAPITAVDVDMPKTYADGVERIRSYRDRIRDAISAGTPSKAHRPLDELEDVLEAMPYLARDAGIPKRQWETVVVAAEDIGDSRRN